MTSRQTPRMIPIPPLQSPPTKPPHRLHVALLLDHLPVLKLAD